PPLHCRRLLYLGDVQACSILAPRRRSSLPDGSDTQIHSRCDEFFPSAHALHESARRLSWPAPRLPYVSLVLPALSIKRILSTRIRC
ncbi:hypothetical protein WOLCODRAFT_139979, partial [Wolfiporia cocos MD-104 SS10]